MKAVKLLPVLLVALFLFGQTSEEAEAQTTFGPQVILADMSELGVGARMNYGLGEAFGIDDGAFSNLYGSFNGNYLFDDMGGTGGFGMGDVSTTVMLFNGNAAVPFDIDAGVTPYAGAGINLWFTRVSVEDQSDSDTSGGLNLLGGLEFDPGVPMFAELQYSTTGFGFLSLSAGFMFGG